MIDHQRSTIQTENVVTGIQPDALTCHRQTFKLSQQAAVGGIQAQIANREDTTNAEVVTQPAQTNVLASRGRQQPPGHIQRKHCIRVSRTQITSARQEHQITANAQNACTSGRQNAAGSGQTRIAATDHGTDI